jgi:phosphatidate cytidylyltransferase
VPDLRLLVCVAGLFGLGAGLILLVHRVRNGSSKDRREDWLKYAVYLGAINVLWAAPYAGPRSAAVVLVAIAVVGAAELASLAPGSHRLSAGTLSLLLLLTCLGHLMLPPAAGWQGRFAFVVLVTAATDSFAQLAGRLLGRKRLCPRLSPKKTVAGVCGGVGTAVGVSLLLGFLLPEERALRLAFLGLVTSLAAVSGDLLFSAIKRDAGVKDFSGLLPGHGGVLDRFDSLIVAAPVFYWIGAPWF